MVMKSKNDLIELCLSENSLFQQILVDDKFAVSQVVEDRTKIVRVPVYKERPCNGTKLPSSAQLGDRHFSFSKQTDVD